MIGSRNEKYGNIVRAFRTGDAVSLETLNDYTIKPENRVILTKRNIPGKTRIEVAKKKWPAGMRNASCSESLAADAGTFLGRFTAMIRMPCITGFCVSRPKFKADTAISS